MNAVTLQLDSIHYKCGVIITILDRARSSRFVFKSLLFLAVFFFIIISLFRQASHRVRKKKNYESDQNEIITS